MAHPFQNRLLLEDAVRITGPAAFNLTLKPAGSLCNLACDYCYYRDKADIYGGREPRMDMEMLETAIREYIAANDVPEVTFNWHGGEPTVLGLAFFRKAMDLERKYADGKTIFNTLQTNGTLLTPEWAEFLRENRFLVGVSVDGPRDLHDHYRKDRNGAPTFDKVLRAIALLQEHGVDFNTMATVNRASEGRGLEVYRFLQSLGSRYMQFLPVVEHVREGRIVSPAADGARIAPWSVSSRGFGDFMCEIFDHWVRHDVGRTFVNLFDATLANWCGVTPGTCAYDRTCGGNAVLEHNGDLYPCDHFVYPEHRLGNIRETPLRTLMESPRQAKFGLDKYNALPEKCIRCPYLSLCHGECPKHRFSRTEDGETGLSTLCEGYYRFYEHTAPAMQTMRELLQQGLPPANVMDRLRR